ncbi:hypothetical protein [Carboxydothermus ferrireducens]|uniref:DUF4878 domain-containing protein n=1 Tax=Carboxydothermus ferrireducens DSM 11255 TaxID=1119529 RepID=A0ABX2R861_9THEO|nr:hypothetical protein [Carboxydothermus ferrireducens]NYE57366.1 hypothetical protein [Carboxydothermus ferrireducens DSM 11255]
MAKKIGILFLLLLVILGVLAYGFRVWEKPEDVFGKFEGALAKGDNKTAFTYLSRTIKDDLSQEKLKSLDIFVHEMEKQGFSFEPTFPEFCRNFFYREFKRGVAQGDVVYTVEIGLVREWGGWKVVSVR